MTSDQAYDIAQQALWTLLLVSAPALIVAMIVGVGIALFQALTQVQEATLTFVPKMFALGVALLASLPLMGSSLAALMENISDRIISG